MDWRAARRVYRFATAAERDAFLAERGWAERAEATDPTRLSGRFRLHLSIGWISWSATVDAEAEGGHVRARLTVRKGDRERSFEVEPPISEWARFVSEMQILGAHRWEVYDTVAFDAPLWKMVHETVGPPVKAGGAGAYPPAGDDGVTPEFARMGLAAERLIERAIWGGFRSAKDLKTIPDERDRVEHLLLAALRAWGAEIEEAGTDPGALKEADLERGLAEQLSKLTTCRTQAAVNGRMADWPRVGAVDIELDRPSTWVELKWVETANDLHNCLWDAGKVAQAQREGQAQFGYLVAGAPERQWRRGTAPTRLFDVSVWRGTSLVTEHPSWWTWWHDENANTYPLRLPTPVITVPVGQVRCAAPTGEEWVVKVARVEAPGTDSYVPPPRCSHDDETAPTPD